MGKTAERVGWVRTADGKERNKSGSLAADTHRVLGVGHGVERTDGQRELVEHEKVGLVLFAHQPAERAFSLGAEKK